MIAGASVGEATGTGGRSGGLLLRQERTRLESGWQSLSQQVWPLPMASRSEAEWQCLPASASETSL